MMKSKSVLMFTALGTMCMISVVAWRLHRQPERYAGESLISSDHLPLHSERPATATETEVAVDPARSLVPEADERTALAASNLASSRVEQIVAGAPDFERKYAGLDSTQLISVYERLSPAYFAERERLIAERWDFGMFTTHLLSGKESAPPPPKRPDGSIASFGFKTEHVDGGMLLKTTVLDTETYPEFALMEMEIHWLLGHIGPGYTPPKWAR